VAVIASKTTRGGVWGGGIKILILIITTCYFYPLPRPLPLVVIARVWSLEISCRIFPEK